MEFEEQQTLRSLTQSKFLTSIMRKERLYQGPYITKRQSMAWKIFE